MTEADVDEMNLFMGSLSCTKKKTKHWGLGFCTCMEKCVILIKSQEYPADHVYNMDEAGRFCECLLIEVTSKPRRQSIMRNKANSN